MAFRHTLQALVELVVWATLLTMGACLLGCKSPYERAMESFLVSAMERSEFTELDARGTAHANNPGFGLEGGMKYFFAARLLGIDGDVQVEGIGTATGDLSDEAKQTIIDILRGDTDLANRIINVINRGPPAD